MRQFMDEGWEGETVHGEGWEGETVVQATNRQVWTFVNFVGSFTFGYFVAYYAGYTIPVVSAMGM